MKETTNIRQIWYQNVSLTSKEWTTMRPLHQLQKMDSIRLVLAISASKHWEVHHTDVKSAFMHGYIHEEIYMKQHEGYITDPSLVFNLKKSLYGLKRPQESGIPRWMPSFSRKTFRDIHQIQMCIYNSIMVI